MAAEDVVLVGRDRELDRLRSAYLAAAGGGSRFVTLSGEAGIGKTTLAEALTRDVWEMHGSAAWGRCWETGGAPAYSPWVQAIRAYARGLDERGLGRLLGSGAEYVVRLVPEIGESLAEAPAATPGSESEEARFALFDAVTSLLRRASEPRPLLLVFDDLHASDASSLRMLRFVARELGDARVLIVGTHRDVEARLDPSVAELITDLNREGERIFVPRLGREDVGRLVARRTGAPAAEPLVTSVHDITAGNPFFVSELVRLLEAEGLLEQVVDERTMPIPEGVR
jgi:predicted ATPase